MHFLHTSWMIDTDYSFLLMYLTVLRAPYNLILQELRKFSELSCPDSHPRTGLRQLIPYDTEEAANSSSLGSSYDSELLALFRLRRNILWISWAVTITARLLLSADFRTGIILRICHFFFTSLSLRFMELDKGLEPLTSRLQITRSTNWANPADFDIGYQ